MAFISFIKAFIILIESIPVLAITLGEKQDTLLKPSILSKLDVTSILSMVHGPNESGVDLELPNPITNIFSLSNFLKYFFNSILNLFSNNL